jgi:hypothetical protein
MDNNELLTVTLEPPRTVSDHKASWWLKADGCEPIQLPKSYVDLQDGQTVSSVTIPRWLAEDRGLIVSEDRVETGPVETISRHDIFMAAAITGICASQGPQIDCSRLFASDVCEAARKIADKATER